MLLPQATRDALHKLCQASPTREVCGVIGTDNRIYEVTNSSQDSNCFVFDQREWLALLKFGIEIQAIYHSHPSGDTTPSEADLKSTSRMGYPALIVTNTCIERIYL